MVPQKTKRGQAALDRLKCFEGIPAPYDTQKRMVIPDALKVLRLGAGHKNVTLGALSSTVSAPFILCVEEIDSGGGWPCFPFAPKYLFDLGWQLRKWDVASFR